MRYEEFTQQVIKEYRERGLADGSSIPDIDLYIEQMVSCLNEELSLYAKDGEGPITKGMISNYTKHKMIPGPEGKRYTKNHCLFMLMVYYLKSSFSMDQVQRLMRPVLANYDSAWDDDMDVASYYREIIADTMAREESFGADIQERIRGIKHFLGTMDSDDDISELLLLITSLVLRSNAERFLAERLLDEYFPDAKTAKKQR